VPLLSLDEAASASQLTDQIKATPPEKYGYEDHFRALQPLRPITLSLGEAAYGIEVAEEELRAFVVSSHSRPPRPTAVGGASHKRFDGSASSRSRRRSRSGRPARCNGLFA
jgi:hypothetical protein